MNTSPTPEARIFISYSRSGAEADAGRLEDWLRRTLGEDRVFTDTRDIDIGANWERVVDHALAGSVAVVLVVSPDWSPSESILYEIMAALDSQVAIIPVLVRGAKWESLSRALPAKAQELRKNNATILRHSHWEADLQPLVDLLRRMLDDPARARVVFAPPDPISVLDTPLDRTNVRSLLVHAADLAECLADESVLAEAQGEAKKPFYDSGSRRKGHSGLTYLLGNARYRLMIEQIGRDLLDKSGGRDAARFLQDAELEEEVRRNWEWFEEERSEWSRTRGELGDPKSSHEAALAADAKARARLQDRLPGITKDADECARLIRLLKNEIKDILSGDQLADYWQYAFLKNLSAYTDMAYELYDRDRAKVREMLERFEAADRP